MKHDEERLKKACENVYYEMWMLTEIATILDEKHTAMLKAAVETDEDEKHTIYAVTHTSPPPRVSVITSGKQLPESLNERLLITHNALVESFAVHARALLDFFYPEGHPIKATDVLAEHFFPTPNDWLSKRPTKSIADIEKIRERVAKEIVHLTYNRQQVKLPDKVWPTRSIATELDLAFKVFKSSISPELSPSGWANNSS